MKSKVIGGYSFNEQTRKATSERNFGMSDKYIIRNCPAYQKELVIMDFKTGETKTTDKNYCINPFYPNTCQDCTDCLLKRIVKQASYCLCPEILELLDIKEVE